MKRIIWMLLVLTALCCFAAQADTNDVYVNVDGFEATLIEVNGEPAMMITGYTGEGGDIAIPGEITCQGVARPVRSIDNAAFYGETAITGLTIPASVTDIGYNAFKRCTNLRSVTLAGGSTMISEGMFADCTALESIVIPASVTNIGFGAFMGCTGLTDVTLTEGLTCLGASMFRDCTDIESITIPSSLTSVGSDVFCNCTNLANVTLADGLTVLGSDMFSGCNAIESIVIPASMANVGTGAFERCAGLTSVTLTEGMKAIGEDMFAYCGGIEDITIPASVSSIGDYAFYGCTGLTHVTLTSGLKVIGSHVFSGCTAIESIVIPASVTDFGDRVFCECTGLRDVTLTNGLTVLGSFMFQDCTSLESIVIPASVTDFDQFVFCGCTGLRDVTLTDGLTVLGYYMFDGCTGLESVVIPASVTEIEGGVFYDCTGLTHVTIPDGLGSIGAYMFENCTSLTSVVIPASVTAIGTNAFYGCTGLTSMTLSEGIEVIGDFMFRNCSSLDNVVIPSSVTIVPYCSFDGCTSLTRLMLPDTLTTIDAYAFDGCNDLADVYYAGTESEWAQVKIHYPYLPDGAQIHYRAGLINVVADPAAGSAASVPVGFSTKDTEVILTAAANPGYRFKGWQIVSGDVNIVNDRFTMPPGDVVIRAVFEVFLQGSGTAADPWRIEDAGGWNRLVDAVEEGMSTAGKHFLLTSDIQVSTMLGTNASRFAGTFDGGGHTITFNTDNEDSGTSEAPFAWTSGATIRDLRVDGAITGSKGRAAGLIGENKDAVSQVINCQVSMTLSGAYFIAGFVVGEGPGVQFTGCLFDGKITATTESGGFAGWSEQNSGLRFTDCLFDPDSGSSFSTNSGTFFYDNYNSGTQVMTNCYYMTPVGTPQGKQAVAVFGDHDLTIDLGTPTAFYDVSGITAYPTGLMRGRFFAGEGENVPLNLAADLWEGYQQSFEVSAGTLAETGTGWMLTLSDEDAAISLRRTPLFDTEPAVGLTFDRGSGGYSNQGPEKLFDGLDDTKWCCSFTGENWVEFHAEIPVQLHAYAMKTGGDTARYTGRNPVSWRLLGKRDASDGWTELTAEAGNDHLPPENCETVFFPLDAFAYRYFRLEVSAVRSGTTLQLSEFSLIGTPVVFGMADLALPAAVSTIEESAFEGLTVVTAVDASQCTFVGKWAFKGCTGLEQIRLHADCIIDPDAFTGCGTVYIFAPAGGATQTFCQGNADCVFIEEPRER